MKSAFILGLALAVNAQVDNELATSLPYHPSGADLVKNAGWGRSLPIGHKTPVDYNTQYLNKYGLKHDAADDEMTSYGPEGITVPFPRRRFNDDELTSYGPEGITVPFPRRRFDDAADDEMTFYGPEGITVPFPRRKFNDDELTFYGPDGITVPFPRRKFNDDEMTFYGPDGITVPFPRRKFNDDELTSYGPDGITVPFPRRRYDDADDELAVLGHLIKESQPEKVEKKTHEKTRKFRPVEKN